MIRLLLLCAGLACLSGCAALNCASGGDAHDSGGGCAGNIRFLVPPKPIR